MTVEESMSEQAFRSFVDWKERHFPDLSKEEKYKKLENNSEQLATALANDTFDRVRREQEAKKT